MRALLLLVVVLTACTTQPNAVGSTTPSPTASATATPTQTPTSSPTPSPTPISLPSIAQLSAPSSMVVWALVAGDRLFKSTDRGATWTEASIPAGIFPSVIDVAFADDRTGFLMSRPATVQCQSLAVTLFGTTDGAASWQKLAGTGISSGLCKAGLSAASTTTLSLVAFGDNSAPLVYTSADGGQTWASSPALPNPSGTGPGSGLQPGRPKAFGPVVLMQATASDQQSRYVFGSQDGGLSYRSLSKAPKTEAPVAFVTSTRWLELIAPGQSMETSDFGASWHVYASDYSQAAPIAADVVFGDASVGYATVRGAIQRTTDGGVHWTTIKTPGT